MTDKEMFKGVTYESLEKQVGGKHYAKMKIQPAEFINENKLLFAEGNAIKYICRHSVKGNERDNVVLFTDLSNAAYNKYLNDPDDEHRLFYVGVTRAKKQLNIIYSRTERGYNI